jgi:hypothetical protein
MASRPEAVRPVDAHGTVRLDTPGGSTLNLVADGENLRLELPGWHAARELMPRSFRGRRQTLRAFAELFATHGLTFNLESGGTPLLRLGHDASPNWFARLLGLAPAQVPVSAIGFLFKRTPVR